MHVEGHHSILHSRQARKKAGGMLALSIILGDIGSLINIAFMAAIIGYGRDLETESDKLAIPRMVEAGFDPREMPRVFELLDQDPEGDTIERKSATWSDHPLGRERRRYSSEILDGMAETLAAAEATPPGLALGEEGYLAKVAASAKDSVRELVAWDRPRTALSVAHRLTTEFPQDPDGWALTGDALVALDARTPLPEPEELTKKAKRAKHRDYGTHTAYERAKARLSGSDAAGALATNRALAEQSYRKALEAAPEHPAALAGLGRLEELRGHDEEAGRFYARYLRAAPETDSQRPATLKRLQVLTERMKKADAARAHEGTK
jgi:tetratricopeptide (TPR) repeat protein